MDMKVHDVDINLDVASYCKKESSIPSGCDLAQFVHMLIGLVHCYYKDRSFVDPLLPEGVKPRSGQKAGDLLRGFSLPEKRDTPTNHSINEEEQLGPDEFLPEVALMDDDLDSSDESDYDEEPDEEHDEAFLAWKREQDGEQGGSSDLSINNEVTNGKKVPSVSQDQTDDEVLLDKNREEGKTS